MFILALGCLLAQGLPILPNLLHREGGEEGLWGAGSWKGKLSSYVVREERCIHVCQVGERGETWYVPREADPGGVHTVQLPQVENCTQRIVDHDVSGTNV